MKQLVQTKDCYSRCCAAYRQMDVHVIVDIQPA